MEKGAHMQEGKGESADSISDINITPLVDVSLVLVIIFMVTSPLLVQAGIIVSSSRTTASEGQHTKDESVNINITQKGVTVNNEKVPMDKLAEVLKARIPKAKDKMVVVTADRDVLHGQVVKILDISKMAGAAKIALMRDDKLPKNEKKKKK
jgi:biopolymer transport protein ExbD